LVYKCVPGLDLVLLEIAASADCPFGWVIYALLVFLEGLRASFSII
jgi:hypothetical protein